MNTVVSAEKDSQQRTLREDHYENALLITVNLDYEVVRPQDVFCAIKEKLLV